MRLLQFINSSYLDKYLVLQESARNSKQSHELVFLPTQIQNYIKITSISQLYLEKET